MRTRTDYGTEIRGCGGSFPANNSWKPFTYPTNQNASYPGYWRSTYVNTSRVVTLFEFADDLNKRSTRNSWNPFQHYKMKVSYPPGPSIPTSQTLISGLAAPWGYKINIPASALSISPTFGGDANPLWNVAPMYSKQGENYSIAPISGLSNLQSTALKAMLPGIRPRLYSLAELYQLKDVKSVKNTAIKVNTLLSGIMGNPIYKKYVPQLLHRFRSKMPLAKILLVLPADLYLQWKFNVAPLLGDIDAIKASNATVADDVRKLIDQQNTKQIRHFSRNVKSAAYAPSTATDMNARGYSLESVGPYGTFKLKNYDYQYRASGVSVIGSQSTRVTEYTGCTFHAQVEYSYNFGDLSDSNVKWKAKLDSLGIGINPIKELWELVPWSFVVDWVVDVSHFLDNLENKNLKPVTVIHNWCWSQKITRTTKIYTTFKSSYPDPEWAYNVPDVNTHLITEEAYKRSTDGYNVHTALTGSGINENEFILSSALAITRLVH